MLARDLSKSYPNATFVVDVKSTGLYKTDPVLKANGATVDYYKTGHSYIKRRTNELGALAGFEKSGHFFFRPPIGLGYDDGLVAATVPRLAELVQVWNGARGALRQRLVESLSEAGAAVVSYDADTETCTILPRVPSRSRR
jgi:phosphomannomutase